MQYANKKARVQDRRKKRRNTYALLAFERLLSTATAAQSLRGRSVCLRTSRIYSKVLSAFVEGVMLMS